MTKNQIRRARRAGFTLIEASLALSLMGLLFIGAMNLYITATRTATAATAQNDSSGRAANAIGRINDDAREAYFIDLPSDADGDSPSSFPTSPYAKAAYVATDGTDAAIQFTYPTASSQAVLDSAGTSRTASPAPYSRGASASTLMIFRSDGSGAPKPNDGQYLWAKGSERGTAINAKIARLYDTNSTPIADAVCFDRPTDSSGTTLKNEVEIRIIAAAFSLAAGGGQQSSESSRTLLTGKCVLMRNHN